MTSTRASPCSGATPGSWIAATSPGIRQTAPGTRLGPRPQSARCSIVTPSRSCSVETTRSPSRSSPPIPAGGRSPWCRWTPIWTSVTRSPASETGTRHRCVGRARWITSIDMFQVGLRGVGSARPADVADARARGNTLVTARELRERGVGWMLEQLPEAASVFIAFDLDGLDPSRLSWRERARLRADCPGTKRAICCRAPRPAAASSAPHSPSWPQLATHPGPPPSSQPDS